MPSEEEKRRYIRSPIRAYARIEINGIEHDAYILDLSRGGARFAIIDEHNIKPNDNIKLYVEGDPEIILEGRVAHAKDHYMGLDCGENGVEISVFKLSD
ncbi:MAG: PilZ domain-containing protein [Agarilytica sp.]